MQIEHRREYSHFFNRDMEYKRYGHAGKPVLVFPFHHKMVISINMSNLE